MSKVLTEINKLYPELTGVRVLLNSCNDKARTLAIKLFELGATVLVCDTKLENINSLNRVLYERAGSMYRYKVVSFSTAHVERTDVFIQIEKPVGEIEKAKHKIDVHQLAGTNSKSPQ